MSTTTDRFELLHALKVKGLATDDFLIAMTGLTARDVSSLVGVLTGEGLVVRRETPRMSGTMITAEGKSAYEELGRDSPLAPSAGSRRCTRPSCR
jgi:predicted transcriptional regulator